jgi:hypothetical protein
LLGPLKYQPFHQFDDNAMVGAKGRAKGVYMRKQDQLDSAIGIGNLLASRALGVSVPLWQNPSFQPIPAYSGGYGLAGLNPRNMKLPNEPISKTQKPA